MSIKNYLITFLILPTSLLAQENTPPPEPAKSSTQQEPSKKVIDEYAKINFKSIMHNAEEIKKINAIFKLI